MVHAQVTGHSDNCPEERCSSKAGCNEGSWEVTKGKVSRVALPWWGFGEGSAACSSTGAACVEVPICKTFPCRRARHPFLTAAITSHICSGVMKWPLLGVSCNFLDKTIQTVVSATIPYQPLLQPQLPEGVEGQPCPRAAELPSGPSMAIHWAQGQGAAPAPGSSCWRPPGAERSQRHP